MGMAILFITHDLGVVKHFADRVLVMCKVNSAEEGWLNLNVDGPIAATRITSCSTRKGKRIR